MKALASLALVFTVASSTFAQGAQPQRPDDSLSSEQAREENAYAVGLQAYLWGLPLQFYGKLMPASEKADVGRLDDFHILANGAEDLPKAVEAQKGFVSMPLSAYLRNGLAYKRPAEHPMIETYESQAPEEIRYFDDLGYWLGKMLPISADSNDSLVASFHQIGLSVGKGFEWQMLDAPTKRGLVRAAKAAPQIIDRKWAAAGETTNGYLARSPRPSAN